MMRGVLIAFCCCLMAATGAHAAEGAGRERSNLPIQLKADELSTDSNNKTATFSGKVSARQGDVTINSDKLIIFYSGQNKEVDKVEAFGNVRIAQGSNLGQADHALYENRAGKIILDGSPKVYRGNDTVKGKVITYDVNDQQSVASGDVEVIIHTREKGKDGGAKP